ncbi:hypothetical protein [Aurantimonas sp. 22II-16-19i]|uniref:hypothetical protein n=1 Tax=Aurantimonas sp. 22II-16-19i TaxID=1317114 RepID=UPI0009F7D64B|nr:hypothetical protein [Aurantimonas sp. 22II-16-19i]ORE91020.1 hypothetical protein ATO4_20199 [Aurantimonas sp. 22II-16-19i]
MTLMERLMGPKRKPIDDEVKKLRGSLARAIVESDRKAAGLREDIARRALDAVSGRDKHARGDGR